jgi:hypothetical protein
MPGGVPSRVLFRFALDADNAESLGVVAFVCRASSPLAAGGGAAVG